MKLYWAISKGFIENWSLRSKDGSLDLRADDLTLFEFPVLLLMIFYLLFTLAPSYLLRFLKLLNSLKSSFLLFTELLGFVWATSDYFYSERMLYFSYLSRFTWSSGVAYLYSSLYDGGDLEHFYLYLVVIGVFVLYLSLADMYVLYILVKWF